MSELHQVTFTWPAGPSKVVITGTFDNWSHESEMTKTDSGFSKTLPVPWDSKVLYKYLVDGQWKAHPSFAQEYDEHGNLNNYYISPSMPASAAVASATDSVLASHGTTSLVSYVTSGVGAAIATVTGIDPINSQQIPVPPTPTAEAPASAPTKPLAAALDPIADEPVTLKLASDTAKGEAEQSKGVVIPNAPEPYKEVNGTLPAELEHPRHSTAAHPSEVIHKPEATDPPATAATGDVPKHSTAAHPSEVIHTPEATSTTTAAEPESVPKHSTAAHPSEVIHKPEATNTTTTTAVDKDAARPSTPTKEADASFPRTSGGSPPTTPRKFSFQRSRGSVSGSMTSSVDGSPSKRKKRDSFFGKIKEVFHHHHSSEKKAASP